MNFLRTHCYTKCLLTSTVISIQGHRSEAALHLRHLKASVATARFAVAGRSDCHTPIPRSKQALFHLYLSDGRLCKGFESPFELLKLLRGEGSWGKKTWHIFLQLCQKFHGQAFITLHILMIFQQQMLQQKISQSPNKASFLLQLTSIIKD